jgi:hypothetical protein
LLLSPGTLIKKLITLQVLSLNFAATAPHFSVNSDLLRSSSNIVQARCPIKPSLLPLQNFTTLIPSHPNRSWTNRRLAITGDGTGSLLTTFVLDKNPIAKMFAFWMQAAALEWVQNI